MVAKYCPGLGLPALLILFAIMPMQVGADTAFVNVNVVPMDSENILRDHVVVTRGDRIVAVGADTSFAVPDGAAVIDGQGGYLIPGLADMHVHLEMRDDDPRSLLLYLAEGSTTVRSLTGRDLNLQWRDDILQGKLEGPTILTAGKALFGTAQDLAGLNGTVRMYRIAVCFLPLLLGAVVFFGMAGFNRLAGQKVRGRISGRNLIIGGMTLTLIGIGTYVTKWPPAGAFIPYVSKFPVHISETTSHTVGEVRRQYQKGFDFIKPYDSLTEEQYLGAIDEAKQLGVYVVGHALDGASLKTIMTSGINEIAHLDELNFYHWRGEFGSEDFTLDYDAIPETVALMKENGVNVISNLSLDEAIINLIFESEETLARPEYRVVRPEMLEAWRTDGRQTGAFAAQGPYRRDMEFPFFFVFIKAIHDSGILVTIGTDTAPFTEGSLPSHIHREMEILVDAGLSNYEALAAGTRSAGQIANKMGGDGDFGTIEIGRRADLVLLEENPLENVSATRNRVGVMARGKWMTQEVLDNRVNTFLATY
jgi:imidazolonepropionase-like amidohydrolase